MCLFPSFRWLVGYPASNVVELVHFLTRIKVFSGDSPDEVVSGFDGIYFLFADNRYIIIG